MTSGSTYPDLAESPLLALDPGPGNESLWEISTPDLSIRISSAFLLELKDHLESQATVVLFRDAKPALRKLLKLGINVARPACLFTLEKLSGQTELGTEASFEKLDRLMESIAASGSKALARLECLAIRPFAHMEETGLYVDVNAWRNALSIKTKQADQAAKTCGDFLAPFTQKDLFNNPILNLNSPDEMLSLFKKALGKELPALSNEVLEALDSPLAKAFLEYREAYKVVSTYGERFLEYVDARGRIHAEFHLLAVSTGRVACTKPNLQNLPSDPLFSDCIVAPKGRALVHADFSACELRVLAGLARDRNFLAAINSDEDFHSKVAESLFEKPVSKTENPHLRQKAKAVNFGIIYGMGAKGLARSLSISDSEAEDILARYFLRYPEVRDFLEHCVVSARKLGYARTLLGRRLYLPEDGDISRIAKNMPIQGTAAEIAKLAMTRVYERLLQNFPNAHLVNMIHDELVVECDAHDMVEVSKAVQEEMMGAQEALLSSVRPEVEVSYAC